MNRRGALAGAVFVAVAIQDCAFFMDTDLDGYGPAAGTGSDATSNSGGAAGSVGTDASAGGADVSAGSGGADASAGGSGGDGDKEENGGAAGAAGGSGNSGAGGACNCGPLEECVGGVRCISKLVKLPTGYSIDATEVTRSQYDAWLITNPSITGQDATCAWNLSFSPDPACFNDPSVCSGACDDHPVVCVDWCDAASYCAAAGKHLCARSEEWIPACSSSGIHAYPYGDTYDEQACNGSDKKVGSTIEAGSLGSCQSIEPGFEGVFDLSGNVYEWLSHCANNTCELGGGSFANGYLDPLDAGLGATDVMLRCTFTHHYYPDAHFPFYGFRCCAQ